MLVHERLENPTINWKKGEFFLLSLSGCRHYPTTLRDIPGSTVELHVQVSNVSLTGHSGDKWMTVRFPAQPHHKAHSHVRNCKVERSTIVSVKQKNRPCGLRFCHPTSLQGPWRLCDWCAEIKLRLKFLSFFFFCGWDLGMLTLNHMLSSIHPSVPRWGPRQTSSVLWTPGRTPQWVLGPADPLRWCCRWEEQGWTGLCSGGGSGLSCRLLPCQRVI